MCKAIKFCTLFCIMADLEFQYSVMCNSMYCPALGQWRWPLCGSQIWIGQRYKDILTENKRRGSFQRVEIGILLKDVLFDLSPLV